MKKYIFFLVLFLLIVNIFGHGVKSTPLIIHPRVRHLIPQNTMPHTGYHDYTVECKLRLYSFPDAHTPVFSNITWGATPMFGVVLNFYRSGGTYYFYPYYGDGVSGSRHMARYSSHFTDTINAIYVSFSYKRIDGIDSVWSYYQNPTYSSFMQVGCSLAIDTTKYTNIGGGLSYNSGPYSYDKTALIWCRIYERYMDTIEMKYNYIHNTPMNDSGIVFHYDAAISIDANGDTLYDISGNNRHASLYNGSIIMAPLEGRLQGIAP